MRFLLLALVLLVRCMATAQNPVFVADQTLKLMGEHEYFFAFAEGDRVDLHVELLMGRELKVVELVQFPDFPVFRTYELDTLMDKSIQIPKTGVYVLRIKETGMGKKVCRFTLHRTPSTEATARIDTRVTWDIKAYPMYQSRVKKVQTDVKTELVSISGKVTVGAGKLGLGKSVNSYQFTLPPNTVRWAYRLAVGQQAMEARKKDAEAFSNALKKGGARALSIQPESALAALALGMAINLSTSTAGEDVQYALVNAVNQQLFLAGEEYKAELWQGGISVDVQKRYAPLAGTWFFAMKNDNWLDDIDVTIDIEAVTETPIYQEEIYLEPIRP
ncbi:MAG: hypothetical protein IPL65_02080 [Lewinellaceae bacterium]|nr:hypothetical protein [Lewinellaceae bacterium]